MNLRDIIVDYLKIVDNGVKAVLYIEGDPGVGKTQIVTKVFRQMNVKHEVLSLLGLSVDDLGGMAYPVNNMMKYLSPCWYSEDLEGVFFDEAGGISTNKQQILLKLLSERMLASGKQSKLKYIILAGNDLEDTMGDEFLRPYKMRLIKIKYEPDIEDFISYLIGVGEKWSSTLISILKKNPAIFMADDKENGVIITPRLLENAARILAANIDQFNKDLFLQGVLYRYAAEFKLADDLLSYDEWKTNRKKYLEEHKSEYDKLILLSYAVPLAERIDFIEDLNFIPNIYTALIKELAANRIVDNIEDSDLKSKYIKWIESKFDIVVDVLKKRRQISE